MLHADTLIDPEYKGHTDRLIHNLFVHLAPGGFFFINWLLSDVVFKASHAFAFIPIVLIYSYINYLETMQAGQALYWFMDWKEDFWGAIKNVLRIVMIFAIVFVGKANFTHRIKRAGVK